MKAWDGMLRCAVACANARWDAVVREKHGMESPTVHCARTGMRKDVAMVEVRELWGLWVQEYIATQNGILV